MSSKVNYGLGEGELPPRFIGEYNSQHYITIDLWEYKAYKILCEAQDFIKELNCLGEKGWEVIQSTDVLTGEELKGMVFREVLVKRRIVKDLVTANFWNELQARMVARKALRGGPIEDEVKHLDVPTD